MQSENKITPKVASLLKSFLFFTAIAVVMFLLHRISNLENSLSAIETRAEQSEARLAKIEKSIASAESHLDQLQRAFRNRIPLFGGRNTSWSFAKPVIYLYPEKTTDISVALHYTGKFTCTYPPLGDGWHVTAHPDGTLINHADKKQYSYLFWEGDSDTRFDMSHGFVVAGKDTALFLQEKLAFMGLTPREYNEFIVYWLPQMQDNPYNLITFQGKDYTDQAKLSITPKPDSLLRVFMVYKPLQQKITIPEQKLNPFTRKGFAVVEWGGGMQGDEGAFKAR